MIWGTVLQYPVCNNILCYKVFLKIDLLAPTLSLGSTSLDRRESQNLCYLKLENIISPQMFSFWKMISNQILWADQKWRGKVRFLWANINIALEWYSVILLWAWGVPVNINIGIYLNLHIAHLNLLRDYSTWWVPTRIIKCKSNRFQTNPGTTRADLKNLTSRLRSCKK